MRQIQGKLVLLRVSGEIDLLRVLVIGFNCVPILDFTKEMHPQSSYNVIDKSQTRTQSLLGGGEEPQRVMGRTN